MIYIRIVNRFDVFFCSCCCCCCYYYFRQKNANSIAIRYASCLVIIHHGTQLLSPIRKIVYFAIHSMCIFILIFECMLRISNKNPNSPPMRCRCCRLVTVRLVYSPLFFLLFFFVIFTKMQKKPHTTISCIWFLYIFFFIFVWRRRSPASMSIQIRGCVSVDRTNNVKIWKWIWFELKFTYFSNRRWSFFFCLLACLPGLLLLMLMVFVCLARNEE